MTTDIRNLDNSEWMVIDLDTGTVLSLNLVLVPVPPTEEQIEELSSSDSMAHDYGTALGLPLLVDADRTGWYVESNGHLLAGPFETSEEANDQADSDFPEGTVQVAYINGV
jgi:hypothetical protein